VKISIDFDGTMWSHMAFFRELMKSMKLLNHQVGCLTGHSDDGGNNRRNDIALMKARGFPEPDFWFGKTEEYQNSAKYKAMVILREGIDIHFDDCDYGNQETVKLFQEILGDQFYRLMIVKDRQPMSIHYE
jgi:hypothetical protein